MKKLKITFLGTGTSQGVPVIGCRCDTCISDDVRDRRLRSSLLVESENAVVTIDAGPDFRQQMLREGVSRLDAVIVTHEHLDHIGGLDDIRAYNYLSRRPMKIFAETRARRAIERVFSYVFCEPGYPGIPRMDIINIEDGIPFSVGNVEVVPVRVFHRKLPVYGFRMGNLAYITDADSIPDKSLSLLKGVDLLVINALRKEKHISHFNLDGALEISRLLLPRHTYLTHIGHHMGRYINVSPELPEDVSLAYDGLTLYL